MANIAKTPTNAELQQALNKLQELSGEIVDRQREIRKMQNEIEALDRKMVNIIVSDLGPHAATCLKVSTLGIGRVINSTRK